MTKHADEPYSLDGHYIVRREGDRILQLLAVMCCAQVGAPTPQELATARRLVLCANYCKGIPNEALESGAQIQRKAG